MLSNFLGISKMKNKPMTVTTTAFCRSSQRSTIQFKTNKQKKPRLLWYGKDGLVPSEVKIKLLLNTTVRIRWVKNCRSSWHERAPKYIFQGCHTICPKPARGCFKAMVLKLGSRDQQHRHHRRICWWQCWTSLESCDSGLQQRLRTPPPLVYWKQLSVKNSPPHMT